MKHDVIIVGGGMAGLTAAAFLGKAGHSVLLCEKEDRLGGLVGSFPYMGFTFDAGIRAMENSGVLFPMLRALNLDVDFIKSNVSIGIEDAIVNLTSESSLAAYQEMLLGRFPGETSSIEAFIGIVKKTIEYMRVLYGIDNPLFMDLKNDREYLRKTLLPWMFKYAATIGKIKRLNTPVEAYLRTFMKNPALVDVIAQHFFRQTPAFFALSYFSLYLDYNYPRGGTGTLISKLEEYIREHGGEIRTATGITSVNPAKKTVTDGSGAAYQYRKLIWCADQKALYAALTGIDALPGKTGTAIRARQALLSDKEGGDSVLTLYLTADLDKAYFGNMHAPHFFYTPDKAGLGAVPTERIRTGDGLYSRDREAVLGWVREFLRLTTYEISIPALRDETLAPEGKTGLIVSTLMDYPLAAHIREMGWYEEFKALCREAIPAALTGSVYPGLNGKITDSFVSTPLTILERTGNTGGAITGWAFTNSAIPAVSSIPGIAKAVRTTIPHILQAGQWTYSPSGFPISILTGKLAADRAIKELS